MITCSLPIFVEQGFSERQSTGEERKGCSVQLNAVPFTFTYPMADSRFSLQSWKCLLSILSCDRILNDCGNLLIFVGSVTCVSGNFLEDVVNRIYKG